MLLEDGRVQTMLCPNWQAWKHIALLRPVPDVGFVWIRHRLLHRPRRQIHLDSDLQRYRVDEQNQSFVLCAV